MAQHKHAANTHCHGSHHHHRQRSDATKLIVNSAIQQNTNTNITTHKRQPLQRQETDSVPAISFSKHHIVTTKVTGQTLIAHKVLSPIHEHRLFQNTRFLLSYSHQVPLQPLKSGHIKIFKHEILDIQVLAVTKNCIICST